MKLLIYVIVMDTKSLNRNYYYYIDKYSLLKRHCQQRNQQIPIFLPFYLKTYLAAIPYLYYNLIRKYYI